MQSTARLQLVRLAPGGMFERIRDLSAAEERLHHAGIALLRAHDDGSQLLKMADLDRQDFSRAVESWSRRVPKPGKRGQITREASLDLNREFLGFLASFRQFLDHHETRIKRTYAAAPEVFEEFRTATRAAYGESFEYRFAYKLRNYAQHCGVPLGDVEFESRLHGGSAVNQLHLNFERDRLLAEGCGKWGSVEADLRSQQAAFPVEPLPGIIMSHLDSIWKRTALAERPLLQKAADTIGRIVLDARRRGTIPVILTIHGSPRNQIEIIMPPVPLMHELGHPEFLDYL
jgi:hypothetical protein